MNDDADPTHCTECDQPHVTSDGNPSCRGHKSKVKPKTPCGNDPMHGQRTCRMHGGSSARARAAGLTRYQADQARRIVHTLGAPLDISPSDALLAEVHRTAGHVHWLLAKIREEHPDIGVPHSLVFGTTLLREKKGGNDWGKTVEAKAGVSIWYQMYLEERKHLAAVCAAALKAGVEERQVRVAEQQGELLAQVIKGILTDLDLTADQQARVSEVVPRHLRLVMGGAA